jgi:hypothetical protein
MTQQVSPQPKHFTAKLAKTAKVIRANISPSSSPFGAAPDHTTLPRG